MKLFKKNAGLPGAWLLLMLVWLLPPTSPVQSQTTLEAREIVRRADDRFRGRTSQSSMTMTVVRPNWSRTLSMKSWSRGSDYALVLITAPAREKGQAFLKRKSEMWTYIPSINRLVKLPPSMMSQSWMGSDFTNDDLLKESSMVSDYHHALVGLDSLHGQKCYQIELIPLPEAAVVWGKIRIWIEPVNFNEVQLAHYDEDGKLVNWVQFSNVRRMDDRDIPTRMEIRPADESGKYTEIIMERALFDRPIAESFFSIENLNKVR